jgi:hypothetical protein
MPSLSRSPHRHNNSPIILLLLVHVHGPDPLGKQPHILGYGTGQIRLLQKHGQIPLGITRRRHCPLDPAVLFSIRTGVLFTRQQSHRLDRRVDAEDGALLLLCCGGGVGCVAAGAVVCGFERGGGEIDGDGDGEEGGWCGVGS